VVSELGSADAKRSLPTLDPAGPAMPADGLHMSSKRWLLVLIVVVGVILVLLAVFVVAARVLGPSERPQAGPSASLTPSL
jgi:hypothetical protein